MILQKIILYHVSHLGRCDGPFIEAVSTPEEFSCRLRCKRNTQCEWYTFDRYICPSMYVRVNVGIVEYTTMKVAFTVQFVQQRI